MNTGENHPPYTKQFFNRENDEIIPLRIIFVTVELHVVNSFCNCGVYDAEAKGDQTIVSHHAVSQKSIRLSASFFVISKQSSSVSTVTTIQLKGN